MIGPERPGDSPRGLAKAVQMDYADEPLCHGRHQKREDLLAIVTQFTLSLYIKKGVVITLKAGWEGAVSRTSDS